MSLLPRLAGCCVRPRVWSVEASESAVATRPTEGKSRWVRRPAPCRHLLAIVRRSPRRCLRPRTSVPRIASPASPHHRPFAGLDVQMSVLSPRRRSRIP